MKYLFIKYSKTRGVCIETKQSGRDRCVGEWETRSNIVFLPSLSRFSPRDIGRGAGSFFKHTAPSERMRLFEPLAGFEEQTGGYVCFRGIADATGMREGASSAKSRKMFEIFEERQAVKELNNS